MSESAFKTKTLSELKSRLSSMPHDENIVGKANNPIISGTHMNDLINQCNLLGHEAMPQSNRPIIGSLIKLSKRFLRRWMRWYYTPIFEQQSLVNQMLVNEIISLQRQIDQLTEKMNR